MRRLILVLVLLAILIGSGVLANGLAQSNFTSVPGVRIQTSNPEASTAVVTASKGQTFLIMATFLIIGPLVTLGFVLALVFFFSSRLVKKAKDTPGQPFSFSLNPGKPNSLGAAMVKHPIVTVLIVFLLIGGGAITVAIVSNVFTTR